MLVFPPFPQKRKERESAIHKNVRLPAEAKAKWMRVMRNDIMSSEDSDDEDVNTVRPLPWRSAYVDKMFNRIDVFCDGSKSAQARRQMKQRIVGEPSDRSEPEGLPDWAVKKTA